MRGKLVLVGLTLALSGMAAMAQEPATGPAETPVPIENDLYCSGLVTTENVPRGSYVISGDEANYQATFNEGSYVYINRGSQQGVRPGDEFLVIRPAVDPIAYEWTKWQYAILHKMGTVWEDEGRVKVVVAEEKTSVAQIVRECNSIQRGDIIVPFEERIAPPLKPAAHFDRFAPPSGKAKAMVIEGKSFQVSAGTNGVVYVNLGSNQGVRVGDYFRVFRYTGMEHETAYTTHRSDFDIEGQWGPTFGLGASPTKWDWSNTPRQVIAEGVVLRASPNAATVLLTFTLREVYLGDYVEIE